MKTTSTRTGGPALHVSLVALPEAGASTLFGVYDVMNAFSVMDAMGRSTGTQAPFQVEIVGERAGPLMMASAAWRSGGPPTSCSCPRWCCAPKAG
jgi:hypothetical protein